MKSEKQRVKELTCNRCGKPRDSKYSLCRECHRDSGRESYNRKKKNGDDIIPDEFTYF